MESLNLIIGEFGESKILTNFLVKFTPKNHPSVKELDMKEGDYLLEMPLNKEVHENTPSVIFKMLDKLRIEPEFSPKLKIENINGINYPVTYLSDGIVIVDYPIFLKNL